jgi:RND family efflux transporter MFP subunit
MKAFLRAVVRFVFPLVLLGAALGVAAAIVTTAPKTERSREARQAPLVEVVPLVVEPIQRIVEAHGTVMPAREVMIAPEVSGRVVEIHPSLQLGGIIREGDLLLRINPEEYELALARAESALAEAQAGLDVERGRQLVAEREWELFGKQLPDAERGQALALREPQLRQAEARISSAQSVVEQAKLDLKRTTIRAPFDALVLAETVDVGQLVASGHTVASLAGTDAFWVQVSVPRARLAAVLEAVAQGRGAARVHSDIAAGGAPLPAVVVRHLGQVDSEGRMALVLLAVDDPLAIEPENAGRQPLPLNSYVRAELDAGTLDGALPIPRKGLRENGLVWVADKENRFRVRETEILWSQGELLALRNTFEPGDQLVVSPVADVVPGMEVRVRLDDDDDAPRRGVDVDVDVGDVALRSE